MSSDGSDEARSTAVEQLKSLGLSTYAARTFIALVTLDEATAREVSAVADVPRTRVYDAVDELRERGLAEVTGSSPKRFWAISTETTGRLFEQEYRQRVTALTDALDAISSASPAAEQRGFWSVSGRDAVTECVVDLVSAADHEIVYATAVETGTDEIVERLASASDRGVSVRLAGTSGAVEAEFEAAVPDAKPFESGWDWPDVPVGRLLLVDGERVLVSVFVPATDGHSEETAIWGAGRTNGLVVVLKALFAWQPDGTERR